MLLLHGAADTTVRPQHSSDLAARARAAGVPVRHVAYPGMGHLGIVAALAGADPRAWAGGRRRAGRGGRGARLR
jgi:acetyl esterase/lipase